MQKFLRYDLNNTCTHGKTCYLFNEFVQILDQTLFPIIIRKKENI